MTAWHDYYRQEGHAPDWPYPIRYGRERTVETDILVVGGGIAGCWAAISAARNGMSVALVDKGDVIRSGAGGPGCDHWCDAPANPLSKVDPDEWAARLAAVPFANQIGRQIQCRENWDCLVELEAMGAKVRDTGDEYVGAIARDPASKLMFSPRDNKDETTNTVIRVWGTTFKPVLKKECKRLGVKIFDRVMVTRLLNEGGVQGARVVGATGINGRTGEFLVFRAGATIMSAAGNFSQYLMQTELAGNNLFRSRCATGDGHVMLWLAGAELTMMERTRILNIGGGYKHTWYGGAGDASHENVAIYDNNGRALPWPVQGWIDGGKMVGAVSQAEKDQLRREIDEGKWALPLWGDYPGMSDVERRVTWNLMLGEEACTRGIIDTYEKAGFDPSRDLLACYNYLEGATPPQIRNATGGGPVIDWDLRTTVEGLYAAGEQHFSSGDHSYAAATGRYAARKAAAYVRGAGQGSVDAEQVAREKARCLAPIRRSEGVEWKELHAGIARAMQLFTSEFKTAALFDIGLATLDRIEQRHVPELHALDPHKLMRSLEDLNLLEYGRIVIAAMKARKASTSLFDFRRIDFPEMDPPEWSRFVTVKLENGAVKAGSLPWDFGGDLAANYEAANPDYAGAAAR
jgi:succinate dehydrogenase/fumarate reductase flavoprotein subunit